MKRVIVSAVGFVGMAILLGLMYATNKKDEKLSKYTYYLPEPVDFLTDDLGVAAALEALTAAGFRDVKWKPLKDERTVSPDGRRDKHLVRNSMNPNRGFILFNNDADQNTRIVFVELMKDRIICVPCKPK